MCMACEMAFWNMLDALPPEQQERILRQRAEAMGIACDAPEAEAGASEPALPRVDASRE